MNKRLTAWQRIMEKDGSRLPDDIQVFYSQLFERLPGYCQAFLAPRFSAPHNLTLIHGDAYFSNFLCSKIPGTGPTYLVDWQSPTIDLAAYDLVNLLATFWRREQRHENKREQVLLRRYYQGLSALGVQNYTWSEFLADYRAGLIFWVLMPVQDGGDGADWSYWRLKMQCQLEAFEDWGCWNDLYSQI